MEKLDKLLLPRTSRCARTCNHCLLQEFFSENFGYTGVKGNFLNETVTQFRPIFYRSRILNVHEFVSSITNDMLNRNNTVLFHVLVSKSRHCILLVFQYSKK